MRFNTLALVAAFLVGMVIMHLHTPKPAVVVKFPSPHTAGRDLYHTSDGSCYRVKPEEVQCPVDRKNVLPQPLTEDDATDPLMKHFM